MSYTFFKNYFRIGRIGHLAVLSFGGGTRFYLNLTTTKVEETQKRSDYINWEEYFMATALLAAKRSKDPVTQVGACIINKQNRIVGSGYNGMPDIGITDNDDRFSWSKNDRETLANKHLYVCHAELNAIINKISANVEGCTMYVTLFPCNECAKIIIQSGIRKIVYLADPYAERPEFKASKRMFEEVGVEYQQYKIHKYQPNIVLEF